MIEKIKTTIGIKFPLIFKAAKRIYRGDTTLVAEGQVEEDYELYLERTIYHRNTPLMKDAFNNEYFVHNGPFVGMR